MGPNSNNSLKVSRRPGNIKHFSTTRRLQMDTSGFETASSFSSTSSSSGLSISPELAIAVTARVRDELSNTEVVAVVIITIALMIACVKLQPVLRELVESLRVHEENAISISQITTNFTDREAANYAGRREVSSIIRDAQNVQESLPAPLDTWEDVLTDLAQLIREHPNALYNPLGEILRELQGYTQQIHGHLLSIQTIYNDITIRLNALGYECDLQNWIDIFFEQNNIFDGLITGYLGLF